MASELEKYVQEKYKKFIKSQWGRSIYRDFLLLLSFSCGHGSIRRSHVKIESWKNSKAKHIHARYI